MELPLPPPFSPSEKVYREFLKFTFVLDGIGKREGRKEGGWVMGFTWDDGRTR